MTNNQNKQAWRYLGELKHLALELGEVLECLLGTRRFIMTHTCNDSWVPMCARIRYCTGARTCRLLVASVGLLHLLEGRVQLGVSLIRQTTWIRRLHEDGADYIGEHLCMRCAVHALCGVGKVRARLPVTRRRRCPCLCSRILEQLLQPTAR